MDIEELRIVDRKLRQINQEVGKGHEFLLSILLREANEFLKKRGYQTSLRPDGKHYTISPISPEKL